ncbi:MAG: ABC transporter permease [Deltaproteobacteria bacterium]|nr:ABC transporter permease [Deltaproteobacteria bacterium]
MTSAFRDFARGLSIQVHVIHALILRETRTAFGQHKLGYIWALASHGFFIGIFAAMFVFANRSVPSGMDVIGFLCTGFLTYNLFMGTQGKAKTAVKANVSLLYYPQVHPLDLVAARCLLEIATVMVAFFLFMFANTIYTQHFPLDSALLTLAGLFLAALLGSALGLCTNSLCVLWPTMEQLIGPLLRPLFWISGLFFSIAEIPLFAREALLWNPVLHVIEMTRDGWFKTYNYKFYSFSYVIYWILGLTVLGLITERLNRNKVLSS